MAYSMYKQAETAGFSFGGLNKTGIKNNSNPVQIRVAALPLFEPENIQLRAVVPAAPEPGFVLFKHKKKITPCFYF
jgi:hypothetical protein